jgi:transcription termination/antitermination protein NusA
MLAAFGEQGIKSIEDLANCATDDLVGWIEEEAGKVTKHPALFLDSR